MRIIERSADEKTLINKMTNHQRHLWARAGYPNAVEFLKPKLKRRRPSKKVQKGKMT